MDHGWPHGSEERRQALLLVEAFQERRRRNWYRPQVWMAGETGLSLIFSFILAMVLVTTAAAGFVALVSFIIGLVLLFNSTPGVRPFAINSFLFATALGIGAIVTTSMTTVVIGILFDKRPTREPGMPYWLSQIISPATPFADAATELWLTRMDGRTVVAALLHEQFEQDRYFVLLSALVILMVGLPLMLGSFPGTYTWYFVIACVAAPFMLTVVLSPEVNSDPENTWHYVVDAIIRGWMGQSRAGRILLRAERVSTALAVTLATIVILYFLCVVVGGFFGSAAVYTAGGIIGLLLIVRLSRGQEVRLDLPGKIRGMNGSHFDLAYEEFAAEELFEDEDWTRRLTRPRLPIPLAWLHVWGPILDLSRGLLHLVGYGCKSRSARTSRW